MTSTYRASLLSSRKLVRAFLKYRLAGSKPIKMIIKWLVYVSLLLVLSLVLREVFKFRARASPVFPSPQKPTFSYSNSTRNDLGEEPLRGWATFISLFFSWLVHFNASLTIYLLSGPNAFREPANSSRHILLCDLQGCAPRCRIDEQSWKGSSYWWLGTLWVLLSEPQQVEYSLKPAHMGSQHLLTSLLVWHSGLYDSAVHLSFGY